VSSKKYSHIEAKELKRRYIGLLFYLLRSPFYDRYAKSRLSTLLEKVSDSVPLATYLIEPVSGYLPAWLDIYFYNWAT